MTDNYTNKLCGLHKEIWKNVDSEEYLKKERQSWDKDADN